MIAPTPLTPPAASAGGAAPTAATGEAGLFAALFAGVAAPAMPGNAAPREATTGTPPGDKPLAAGPGQALAVTGTVLPIMTAALPATRSSTPPISLAEEAIAPALPVTLPTSVATAPAPLEKAAKTAKVPADKDDDAPVPAVPVPIAPVAAAMTISLPLPGPVATDPPAPAALTSTGAAPAGPGPSASAPPIPVGTPPAVSTAASLVAAVPLPVVADPMPPVAAPSAAPATATLTVTEPPVPQGQTAIGTDAPPRPVPAPATPPATIAVAPAATAALPAAPALAPVVGAAAPARQLFAAAIEAADRQDRSAGRPADAQPAAVASLDAPSLRPVTAAAPGGGQQGLDMRHDTWPSAMIDHIERLRDAADAADTRIRLVPDALGGIDVAISRQSDGVHVALHADQPATQAMLAEARPQLTDLASARGLRLADTSVGGGAAGFAEQQRQPAPRPAAFTPPAATATPADDPDAADGRIA